MVDAQQFSGAMSRRRALLTGAGLVAAGVAVGATGGLATAQFAASGSFAAVSAQEAPLPVMVHLLDASTGQLDVFFGDNKVTIEDAAFVAKLVELTTAPPASSPAR
jgi:hypothetical protein